jgi:hypothetical protein
LILSLISLSFLAVEMAAEIEAMISGMIVF